MENRTITAREAFVAQVNPLYQALPSIGVEINPFYDDDSDGEYYDAGFSRRRPIPPASYAANRGVPFNPTPIFMMMHQALCQEEEAITAYNRYIQKKKDWSSPTPMQQWSLNLYEAVVLGQLFKKLSTVDTREKTLLYQTGMDSPGLRVERKVKLHYKNATSKEKLIYLIGEYTDRSNLTNIINQFEEQALDQALIGLPKDSAAEGEEEKETTATTTQQTAGNWTPIEILLTEEDWEHRKHERHREEISQAWTEQEKLKVLRAYGNKEWQCQVFEGLDKRDQWAITSAFRCHLGSTVNTMPDDLEFTFHTSQEQIFIDRQAKRQAFRTELNSVTALYKLRADGHARRNLAEYIGQPDSTNLFTSENNFTPPNVESYLTPKLTEDLDPDLAADIFINDLPQALQWHTIKALLKENPTTALDQAIKQKFLRHLERCKEEIINDPNNAIAIFEKFFSPKDPDPYRLIALSNLPANIQDSIAESIAEDTIQALQQDLNNIARISTSPGAFIDVSTRCFEQTLGVDSQESEAILNKATKELRSNDPQGSQEGSTSEQNPHTVGGPFVAKLRERFSGAEEKQPRQARGPLTDLKQIIQDKIIKKLKKDNTLLSAVQNAIDNAIDNATTTAREAATSEATTATAKEKKTDPKDTP
jgi:hypothetical protein